MSNSVGTHVRFNILGPLEGWVGGERIRLSGQIHERVLATLLLEPGNVVPVARLVEAVWDEEPPVTASHQVRKAVADLRRRIPDGGKLIITDGPGYRVEVAEGQLDLHEFLSHVREARTAAGEGRTKEAAESLRSALAVWRGPVLSGAGGSVVQSAAAVLEERRLAAAEQLCEMRMAQGESGEVVGDLRTLIAQHPLRETLRGQLMLALYRSGRQADALAEYAQVRELLVEELGIDPSARLTKMYENILRASPELTGPDAAPPGTAVGPVDGAGTEEADGEVDASGPPPWAARVRGAPCTLPPSLPDFTGRERELAEVLEACRPVEGDGPRVVAVDGMGGAGKTSLVVRASHQLAEQYPDGQLYIDLRGFTPGEEPICPGVTISGLLRVLGVPADSIPDDEAGRIGLWRSTLTGRRLLLLLDNAFEAGQVLPLLPSSSESLVLVTSRARLLDLDGARWISLGVMPPEESRAMLTEILGDDRASREPEAAGELAELCGHLPLALRLAVARLRNRPRWTVRYLVERLDDETRRLDELSAGERSVAATLNLSYRAMEVELQGAFRLLGLHPGAEVDVYSAAALLEAEVRDAEDMLEDLLDMHLMVQNEPGLYAFHDLVRTYALSLGDGRQGGAGREAAERLLGYYTGATEAACALLFPTRRKMDLTPPDSGFALPSMRHEDRILEWFDREATGIQALLAQVAQEGSPQQVFVLARNASFHLNIRSRHTEFEAVCRAGLVATRNMGDSQLISRALNNLGVARWKLGRFTEAVEAGEESLDWTRKSGDLEDQEATLGLLGLVHYALGNLERAYDYTMQALKLVEGRDDVRMPHSRMEDLNTVVSVCTSLGRYEEAADAARQSIERCRQLHVPGEELVAWTGLAMAQCGMGEFDEAAASLTKAMSLESAACMPENRALAHAVSADVYDRLGDAERSQECEDKALSLISPATPPQRRSRAANFLALKHSRHGRYEEALELHERALHYAEAAGYQIEVAHALNGMAEACQKLGRPVAAEYQERADALFETMGVPSRGRRVV
ncbi:BTAD domain-containing putative transcriptional regulator [Streptomyces sp. NPDC002886]|uniref:AfsR/SARP family transcriptional regulator n=1 Tax=Streptomyces sp. NPDC002886 TaxID=3364667 RepID=UPI0036A1E535